MQLLLDVSPKRLTELRDLYPQFVGGQLMTPASSFCNAGGTFAVDNGCFGVFDQAGWQRLLDRNKPYQEQCLWVAAPDVVGSARRTLEVFGVWGQWLRNEGWPVALVAQDGIEDLAIPWAEVDAVFIGGTDRFKDSDAAKQVAKAGKLLGKAVHLGRVNAGRYRAWKDHADTCDGSGYSRFSDEMFRRLLESESDRPLLQEVNA